jgi:hypothetical protein
MFYFQTKNTNLGKIWRALEWKMLSHFMTIRNIFWSFWNNLLPFGIICGHLVYFSRFGMSGQRIIWQPCSLIIKILKFRIWNRFKNRQANVYTERGTARIKLSYDAAYIVHWFPVEVLSFKPQYARRRPWTFGTWEKFLTRLHIYLWLGGSTAKKKVPPSEIFCYNEHNWIFNTFPNGNPHFT